MAFEIGERVGSTFTGPGTVMGELEWDEYRTPLQRIHFDHPLFGERKHSIAKLQPLPPEKPKKVKEFKVKKFTDIQKLQQSDPAALQEVKKYSPRLYIYCNPSGVAREASRLGIDEVYINATTELSHGAKHDIRFVDPVPEGLLNRLAVEIQDVDIVNNRICSRNLAIWLIGEGVMPISERGGDGSKT